MIEYVIQQEGEKKVAVGIRGDDKDEITHHYWGFWNHAATSSGNILWANDYVKPYLGYFWTSQTRLKKALVSLSLNAIFNEGNLSLFKGKKGGVMPYAREWADLKFTEFKPMRFLVTKNKYDFYDLGRITAENLTDYDSRK